MPPDHPVWPRVADELGELMAILLLTLSPERIVLGGGLGFGQQHLLPRIRKTALDRLASYLDNAGLGDLSDVIVPAQLGADAGPLGSIALGLVVCTGIAEGG